MEDDENDISFQVRANSLDDQIWVLIPPQYWHIENMSEMVKMAIDIVLEEESKGSPSENETH